MEEKEQLADEVKKGVLRARDYVKHEEPLANFIAFEIVVVSLILGFWIASVVNVILGDDMEHMLVTLVGAVILAVFIFQFFGKLMFSSVVAKKIVLNIFSLTWGGLILYTAKVFGGDWITAGVMGVVAFFIARWVHFTGFQVLKDGLEDGY